MPERILVVDDDRATRDLLEAVLTDAGYEVTLVPGGPAALAAVATAPPALILLDLRMPGMSGLEVCRALKRDPTTAPIPVLVVTAYGELDEKERTLRCGADDVVTKPIDAAEMLPRVRALLTIRHLRQPLDRTLNYLAALEIEHTCPHPAPPARDARGAPPPGALFATGR